MKWGIPLGDPRLEAVTVEQAQLDVLLHQRWHNPESTEKQDRDDWFAEQAKLGAEGQAKAPMPDAAGNLDQEAAMAALEAIKARQAATWNPEGTYEVESLG